MEEIARKIKEKHGPVLFTNNHINRSLERLVDIEDVLVPQFSPTKLYSLGSTGQERFLKKRADYEDQGILSSYAKMLHMMDKYCFRDIISLVLRKVMGSCGAFLCWSSIMCCNAA